MKILFVIGALLGFAVAALGLMTMRSDIQFIVAAVGFFAGFILLGIALLIERADQIWRQLKEWRDA